LLIDTGKPRKTCVEVAGRRTFRILTYSQQSDIKREPKHVAVLQIYKQTNKQTNKHCCTDSANSHKNRVFDICVMLRVTKQTNKRKDRRSFALTGPTA